MSADLVAWHRAQLDEDAEAARKAASRCGCHPPAPNWLFDDESTGGRILVADDPHADIRHKLTRRWNGSYNDMFAAEHIARHDPARALRGVAADLTLLDAYERVLSAQHRHRAAVAELDADIATENRTGVWSGAGFPDVRQHALRREADYLDGIEPVLRTLVRARAAVYADRPGYREEWRPT